MAAKHELTSIHFTCYAKLLDLLALARHESPEAYDAMANMVRKYRERAAEASGMKGLPEVPKK